LNARKDKIYIAAMFSQRAAMEIIADELKGYGFEIVARWVYGGEDGLSREQIALTDIADVDACDTLVAFTQCRGTMHTGGGRHVEFGYALAKGKKIIVIGDRETVFHHHPAARVYRNMDDWLYAARVL